jgi:hypothetical protein
MPGFGGYFLDQSDRLNVYLTKPDQQKETAVSVLSGWKPLTKLLSRKHTSVADMKVLKGQYTFLKLQSWKSQLVHKIAQKAFGVTGGVYSIGVDQSKNKVSMGVKNKSVRKKVIDNLARINIPKDAVAIYQMSKPEFY